MLKTVHKQFRKFHDVDRGIKSFLTNLNLKSVVNVDIKQYYRDFQTAEKAFKHHLVFCPSQQQITPLTPLPEHLSLEDMPFLGSAHSPARAQELAAGNIDPHTGHKVASFPASHRGLQDACRRWRHGSLDAVTSCLQVRREGNGEERR